VPGSIVGSDEVVPSPEVWFVPEADPELLAAAFASLGPAVLLVAEPPAGGPVELGGEVSSGAPWTWLDWLLCVVLAASGVPGFGVDGAAVVVVSRVVVTWPVEVPVGWVSATAGGAENSKTSVTAEIATPPPPASLVQVPSCVPALAWRIRSSRSNGLDHDSVASSRSRMSTVA
jgi:hypothetical protein